MFKYSIKQSEYSKYKKEQINFDHIITLALIVITVILFTAMQLTAQVKVKKDVVKNRNIKKNNTQTTTTPNSTQATGDVVNVKDDAGNALMTVTDEGSAGSIKLNDAGAVTPNTNKLYNNGGSLYWNGSALSGGSSATELNDLTDAKYDGGSLFVGNGAGVNDDAGASDGIKNYNTGVGNNALHLNTTGYYNTVNGYDALYFNTGGAYNIAIGTFSLNSNTTGNYNIGIGYDSNRLNQEGSKNTIIGYKAGRGSSAHNKSGNVFLGYQAGYNETGNDKLYIENSNSSSPLIWGDFANDSIRINGKFHAIDNITGDKIIGSINNLVDGKAFTNTIYLGKNAGKDSDSTLKLNNIGIGTYSLYSNVDGKNNISIGTQSLLWNKNGSQNISIGNFSFRYNENGSKNTVIGYGAGGDGNINSLHSISGNVFLGYKAGFFETSNNKLYINNDSSSSPLIWGDFANDSIKINGEFHVTNNTIFDGKLGVGTQNPSDKVEIIADAGQDGLRVKIGTSTKFRIFSNGGTSIGANNSGGTPANGLYVQGDIKNLGGVLHTSDRRFKKNIALIPNALEKLKTINGVYYNWKTEEYPERSFTENKQIGVIAQDVEKVFPELVDTDSEGYKSVNYSKLTPILIEAIKTQEVRIKTQEMSIKTQDKRIKSLEEENAKLKTVVEENSSLKKEISIIKATLSKLVIKQGKVKLSSK